ncbi:hypothetical protein BKA65DRAFT_127679 [Rhexocercosporidium sp. MPI-PUGE-AT-0058]|nr:hypothetical protein BKA65DRAFT_127679 [Rhexocercosporidium sp. MPI-PUGE-AT-0058]
MGNGLSHIVDTLHALPESQRAAALDQLLQDKTFYDSLVTASEAQNFRFTLRRRTVRKPKPTPILEPSKTVDSTAIETWSKDLSAFWTSPQSEFDPWSGELAHFYDNTLNVEESHGLYAIRGRFMKLFFCDLLYLLNPLAACDKTNKKLYDQLTNIIARKSEAKTDPQLIRSNLTEWVRAGRRYHKLAASYGPAILFVLPDSFTIDFLEKRLPLKDDAFKTATKHFGPLKEHAEKLDSACKVAEQLRKKTLAPYIFLKEHILTTNSQTTIDSSGCTILYNEGDSGITITSHKGTKRKANLPPQTRNWKKQQKHPANATVRSRSVPQVNGVAVHPQDESFDHDPGSTTQLSNERTLHVYGGGNLPLAAVTGADDWGAGGHAIKESARQHQDIEGVLRTVQHGTNQRAAEGSGETMPDRTEITPMTRENTEMRCEGKMLCFRSRPSLIRMCQSRRPYAFQPQGRRLG